MPEQEIYRYRGYHAGSSRQYGNCEICGQPGSEIYHQVEERLYDNSFAPESPQDPEAPKGYGWTQHKCHSIFGHLDCLKSKRRGLQWPLSIEDFRKHFCAGKEFDACRNSPCQFSGEVCQHPFHPAHWGKPHAPAT